MKINISLPVKYIHIVVVEHHSQVEEQSNTCSKFLTVLFNSARYTCEASSTLVKEANVGLKNRSVTGNTGQCQNSGDITLP